MTPIRLPRLYAIVDAETLGRRGVGLREFALELKCGGVELVQWRAKGMEPRELLEGARVLREVFPHGCGCRLIMNDRVDLAVIAGFDGVHVGQEDLLVGDVRAVALRALPTLASRRWGTGIEEEFIVGVSTHTEEQVRALEPRSEKRDPSTGSGQALGHSRAPDYVAVGPVFATGTKADAAEVVGLEGVRRARALTGKPLVGIGGITRENARSVVDAGADCVAVISGLFAEGERVEDVVREFSRLGRS